MSLTPCLAVSSAHRCMEMAKFRWMLSPLKGGNGYKLFATRILCLVLGREREMGKVVWCGVVCVEWCSVCVVCGVV